MARTSCLISSRSLLITVSLVFRNAERRGERISVEGKKFVVGRHASCDFPLKSDKVSRQHCAFLLDGDFVAVVDLGSRNGTFVNGRRLGKGEQFPLGHRDRVQVGNWKFRMSMRDAAGNPVESLTSPMSEGEISGADLPVMEHAEDVLKELDEMTTQMEIKARDRKRPDGTDLGGWTKFGGSSEQHEIPTRMASSTEEETVQERRGHRPDPSDAETKEISPEERARLMQADAEEPDSEEDTKAGPQKLPEHLRPKGPDNSTDAASQALKRHFGH